MTDRPISFSGPMVFSLIADTKTQTRRTINFAAIESVNEFVPVATDNKTGRRVFEMKDARGEFITRPAGKHFRDYHFLPRYAVSDRLYVREAWRSEAAYNDLSPSAMGGDEAIRYEADGAHQTWGYPAISKLGRFRQGMHMPRWASRLTLIVTDVRVQRLHDCTEADALAEGVVQFGEHDFRVVGVEHPNPDLPYLSRPTAREMYAALWDVINGSGAWLSNPWVSATTFEVIKQNIDQITEAPHG